MTRPAVARSKENEGAIVAAWSRKPQQELECRQGFEVSCINDRGAQYCYCWPSVTTGSSHEVKEIYPRQAMGDPGSRTSPAFYTHFQLPLLSLPINLFFFFLSPSDHLIFRSFP
jgi:hypothetical protein